jgi:ribosomal protein S18 acetylase RimI-like enzyme
VPELTVRPMNAQEFAAFRDQLATGYAADKVAAGEWSAADAGARAVQATDDLLPAGVETPGMRLLAAELVDEPGTVGLIWIGPHANLPADTAWIWDIQVVPEHRGRGLGRALLAAGERAAIEAGFTSLGLNVFGPNAVARGLYESSGYDVTSLQMRKTLTTGQVATSGPVDSDDGGAR